MLVQGRRAVGVEAVSGTSRTPFSVHASREVIVCSGAIGSPRLLMHSGIGPADHLRSVGLAPVHDLPGVGSNLQDHLDLFVIAECTGDHTYDKYQRPWHAAWAGLQYLLLKKGPAASSLFETGGFWYADPDALARSPDIQFHLGLGSGIEAGITGLENAGVTLNTAYLRPRSRGTVRLADADPASAPLIDPNYWADPHDRAMSIKGLRLARKLLCQPALRRYVHGEVLPGGHRDSDAELSDYACAHAKTDHHPVGTCRMGPEHDPDSVVTPQLQLIGMEGLRVADASVMPFIPRATPTLPPSWWPRRLPTTSSADWLEAGEPHADPPSPKRRPSRATGHEGQSHRSRGPGPAFNRSVYAAAHVVIDPLATTHPWDGPPAIDWEATLAFREHLYRLGFKVAEAMDTAQRGMGLDWPSARELIQRSARHARAVGGQPAARAPTSWRRNPGSRWHRSRGLPRADGCGAGRRLPRGPHGQPRPGPGRARPAGLSATL